MVHKPLYEQIPVQIWTKFWLINFQLHFSEQCTLFFVFERKLEVKSLKVLEEEGKECAGAALV